MDEWMDQGPVASRQWFGPRQAPWQAPWHAPWQEGPWRGPRCGHGGFGFGPRRGPMGLWGRPEFWRQSRGPRGWYPEMGRRFPFGGGQGPRMFERGYLKYALLDLLQEHPKHGYEMMKDLQERMGGFYAPSAGAIYPTLQMLEDRGWASSETQEGKKVYTITDEGRRALAEAAEQRSSREVAGSPASAQTLAQSSSAGLVPAGVGHGTTMSMNMSITMAHITMSGQKGLRRHRVVDRGAGVVAAVAAQDLALASTGAPSPKRMSWRGKRANWAACS